MIELREKKFKYTFSVGWQAIKWDETQFYKTKFQSFGGTSKAAEFIAFKDDRDDLWLVECKDFRPSGRSKTIELCDEIAEKFKATMAGLICARNADEQDLRKFARMALKKCTIRCVVHWEHPLRPHRLWPSENMDRANMRQKLRQRLAVADPLAELGNQQQLQAILPWTIEQSN